MDDIRTMVKELHRIADAGERIVKALEKQQLAAPINMSFSGEMAKSDVTLIRQWVKEAVEQFMKSET